MPLPVIVARVGTRRFRRLLVLVALGMAWSIAIAAPPRDLTRTLPEDTLVVVQVRDVPALIAHWKASPLRRFYEDPRAAGFLAPLRRQLRDLQARLARRHHLGLEQALRLCGGSLALAGVPTSPGAAAPIQWVLVLEHNGDPRLAKLLQDEAVWHENALEEGTRVEKIHAAAGPYPVTRVRVIRELAAAVPIQVLPATREGPLGELIRPTPSIQPTETVKRQQVEEFLVAIGPSLAIRAPAAEWLIEGIFGRQEGARAGRPVSSLADTRAARRPRRTAGGGDDIEVDVNLGALARWHETHHAALKLPMRLDARGLGLTDLLWLAAGADLTADRLALTARLTIVSQPQGIGRLLTWGENAPIDAAGVVPPTASFYSSTTFRPDRLWDLALELIGRASPSLNGMLQLQLQSFAQATGVDLRADLLGHLGGHVVRFAQPAPKAGGGGAAATWMLDLIDPAAFGSALRALLEYGTQVYGAYQLDRAPLPGGGTFWTLRAGRPDVGYVGQPFFHAALRDRWLLLGFGREGIDAALERLEFPGRPALRDRPAFQEVMKRLPRQRFWEGYADPAGLARTIDAGWFIPRPTAANQPAKPGALIDMRSLPGPAVWGEFFGPLGGSRSREADGSLTMEAFVLYR